MTWRRALLAIARKMPGARRVAVGGLLPALGAALLIGGCATPEAPSPPTHRPAEARARTGRALPAGTPDAAGWATDIYAAFSALRLEPSMSNVCAVVAVAEQESGLKVHPVVPGLGTVAWREIDRRAERAGVPVLLVHGALRLGSGNGKSYAERIDAARTEEELSDVFEDFVDMVPMGRRLFAGYNPVRTGGPMQVSIAFAERHAQRKPYPYPVDDTIRQEVFGRRGGMYFGIAHLLDYPAAYDRPLYRFADFNAGHYASRNAAFQAAVTAISGIPLALDGDLIRPGGDADRKPGPTELATRVAAARLGIGDAAVRRALEQGESADFSETALYRRMFELADRIEGRPLPRARLPQIALQGPKITRKLTTEWFAQRVETRYQRCLARSGGADG
jgi:hypothetical protein